MYSQGFQMYVIELLGYSLFATHKVYANVCVLWSIDNRDPFILCLSFANVPGAKCRMFGETGEQCACIQKSEMPSLFHISWWKRNLLQNIVTLTKSHVKRCFVAANGREW